MCEPHPTRTRRGNLPSQDSYAPHASPIKKPHSLPSGASCAAAMHASPNKALPESAFLGTMLQSVLYLSVNLSACSLCTSLSPFFARPLFFPTPIIQTRGLTAQSCAPCLPAPFSTLSQHFSSGLFHTLSPSACHVIRLPNAHPNEPIRHCCLIPVLGSMPAPLPPRAAACR